jgi:hypothetical protein
VEAKGGDVTAADDNQVHLVPIAIGAIAIIVRLPAGCDYSAAANKPLDGNRPAITNALLEKAFAGDSSADTWGELIPGVDATCAAKKVNRVVRQDSSGSTFALKQLLARINPARGWAGLANQAWPDLAGHPVYRSKNSGGGALRDLLASTATPNQLSQRDNGTLVDATIDFGNEGGIGYADLATARGGANQPFTWANAADTLFWVPLQRGTAGDPNAGNTYDDPQAAAAGYNSSSALRGAACNVVTPRNVPATPADPTFGDWTSVDATATGLGYAACTLTYDMAFDDPSVVYCNSAAEERKARTVKDFLTVATDTLGQNTLPGQDYDVLPANVATIAKNAVAAIGWKKDGSGRPCTTTTTPPPAQQQTTPPPSTTTPPPANVSNAITIPSARVSGTTIKLSVQCPGAGKLSIASSAKPKKGKAVKLATKSVTVGKAGSQAVSLSLSSSAKKALRSDKKLKFTIKVTFTPTGGSAKTLTKTVTVKQPKK